MWLWLLWLCVYTVYSKSKYSNLMKSFQYSSWKPSTGWFSGIFSRNRKHGQKPKHRLKWTLTWWHKQMAKKKWTQGFWAAWGDRRSSLVDRSVAVMCSLHPLKAPLRIKGLQAMIDMQGLLVFRHEITVAGFMLLVYSIWMENWSWNHQMIIKASHQG